MRIRRLELEEDLNQPDFTASFLIVVGMSLKMRQPEDSTYAVLSGSVFGCSPASAGFTPPG